ncbi:putative disease resistance protein RGA1 isoform X2 [Triticum urartu]|uniref:putative disease resistance protein RGA1 isoform X2 n=1 Tax=Triticum urartu TaxID=4572 RepID=UPI002043047A|nr:putative disease resistance protein RGA1 isoform X2 [Triticum urartu]XP_048561807.1 putative disease resistance protein RGA1 isoform X2 [Triticum urartu]
MATILESLLGSCANKLQNIISDEAILILGVEEELAEVLRRVELIRCCIYDAEKRRTKELAVNNWLGQLRDVIYDVDEILDMARCKGSKLLPDHPLSSSKSASYKGLSVSSCFCNIGSRHDIAVRIRSLNKRIENISKDTTFLTFSSSSQPTGNGPTTKLIRSSNLVEPNLVGKEIIYSSKKLVDLALAHKANKSYKLAIVGTGGVGKTTLAQKIFNDQKIKGSFKLQAWICVSRDYNEITVLKEVLRNIGVYHEQGETIAELQRKLAETVEGKSFFLVLDDVWHPNVWMDLLRTPFHTTNSGVILVTTRDDQIAMRIGIQHTHQVDLMSAEVGWELLWKSMNIAEEKEVHNLRNTGKEIVDKCVRLPLAIKVTASALASKDLTENEWRKFLGKYSGSQGMLSDEIEGTLYLSYDELPHRLKQCFLYCALYTEDSIIYRGVVTKLWIAEGFIEEQQGQLLEHTAEEYYYELIHRNLLQPDGTIFNQAQCRMHDLLRQLACKLSRDECFIGDAETLRGENMSKLRRLSVVNKKDKLVLTSMDNMVVKSLPSAMTQLCNLRCLRLTGTKVNQVPKGIGELNLLTELRGFLVGDISDNADVQDGWKLEELSSLPQMMYLNLVKLERTAHFHTNVVLEDKKHLKELVLEWTTHGEGPYSEDVCNAEKVFELLVPPCNLETLYIFGFFGQRYPTWFGTTCLSSVTHLFLKNLQSCVDLPPVGQLPNLKFLRIDGAHVVTKVGPEFVGYRVGEPISNEFIAFPKLEWFFVKDMPNWEEWSFFKEVENVVDEGGDDGGDEIRNGDAQSIRLQLLPRLVKLKVEGCPKLSALPRQLGEDTASLKELLLIGANSLKAVDDLPVLELLVIEDCEGMEKVSNLPEVSKLQVRGCPNLSHVEGLGNLQQLGLGEDMQEISSRWVPGLQNQRQRLHGEDLDVYTLSTG